MKTSEKWLVASAVLWLRASCTAFVFALATFSHSYFETPVDQFTTWAHGSHSPGHIGQHGLLGIESTTLGILAATLTIALSLSFLITTVLFIRDGRRQSRLGSAGARVGFVPTFPHNP